MKKLVPIVIIFLLVLGLFRGFIFGKTLPVPTDTIVGLYYPFRDLYAKTNPNGLPFHNFLITDPVRQQYPWRNLSIEMEKKFQLPLWDPYSFGGAPLLANFQSAALYPLNILFFIFPFATAWSVLVLLEPLLGGIFLFLYLRNLRLHPIASLLGAIAFAFSGFSVAWLEWNTVLHTVIWLPLVLLAKDKLLQKWSIWWTVVFLFSEVAAFFAGHLQVLFYALCISNAYLAVRIFQKAQIVGNGLKTVIKIYMPFLVAGIVMFAITAIQWVPTLQFISLSARNIDQNWHQAGWFIPWQNIVQFIMPDFFGNPTTGNYWGLWNYAEFVGYVGIIPLLMGIYALFFRHDRKTLFFGSLFFLSLLFAFPTFLAQLPFQLSIPLLSTSQPTRLLFITDFSLAILAALGFDYFLKQKKREIIYPVGFLFAMFVLVWILLLANTKLHLFTTENLAITKHNIVLPTIIFCLASLFIVFSILFKNKKNVFLILTSCFLLFTIFDLFRFADKFETFASPQYLYPSTKIITYLQQHTGNSRIMTTDDRILPPNFSVMYHLQTVDGYDPLYLLRYGELIAASERGKPDISTPFGFNRIITPKNYNSKIMDMLGVSSVLSLSDISDPHLTKVMQDGQTILYTKRSLPRAAFFTRVEPLATKQQEIQRIFEKSFDPYKTAIASCPQGCPDLAKVDLDPVGEETVNILSYSENKIILQGNVPTTRFLVLFDQYYPTWHATIDGRETKIYLSDYAFRGIIFPSGKHTVVFYNTLF